MRTYAMFNYEQMDWISAYYEGRKGPSAYVRQKSLFAFSFSSTLYFFSLSPRLASMLATVQGRMNLFRIRRILESPYFHLEAMEMA